MRARNVKNTKNLTIIFIIPTAADYRSKHVNKITKCWRLKHELMKIGSLVRERAYFTFYIHFASVKNLWLSYLNTKKNLLRSNQFPCLYAYRKTFIFRHFKRFVGKTKSPPINDRVKHAKYWTTIKYTEIIFILIFGYLTAFFCPFYIYNTWKHLEYFKQWPIDWNSVSFNEKK